MGDEVKVEITGPTSDHDKRLWVGYVDESEEPSAFRTSHAT